MTKKLFLSIVGSILLAVLGIFVITNTQDNSDIKLLREQHQVHLDNSPFKETKNLSKEERKSLGLPPNAYNEQVWELTMDPQTGRPMTERVFETLEQLKNQRGNYRGVGGDATNPWVERGPNNVAGRTRGLMFDPNDVGAGTNGDGIDYNRVFAGGVSGGLWVNDDITDANSSWSLVPGFASNTSVTVIISDPNNSSTFYLGSGESYTTGNAIGNGIWKSTDGGVNWSNVLGGYTGTSNPGGGGYDQVVNGIFYINDLVARNNVGTTEIFAAVASAFFSDGSNSTQAQWHGIFNQGLYKSTDNGATWGNILSTVNPNDIELDINNNVWLGTTSSSGVVTTGGDIYRSTDGSNFSLMGNITGASRVELEPDPSNTDALWALANVGGPANIFSIAYITGSPGSVTVTQITTEPADADTGIPNSDFTRNQAFYDLTIESDASGNLIVGGIDLFRSTDGGATWSQISKWSNNNNLAALPVSLVHADHHATVNRPGAPNEYIFGTDGGVFYCTDITLAATSAVIPSRNKDYNTTQFYYGSIDQFSTTPGHDLGGGTQDNGTPFSWDNPSDSSNLFDFRDPLTGDGGYTEIDGVDGYAIATYPGNTSVYIAYPSLPFLTTTTVTTGGGGNFINQAELDTNLDILYSNASTGGTYRLERVKEFIPGGPATESVYIGSGTLTESPTALKVSPYTTTSTTLYVGQKNGVLWRVDNADSAATGGTWTIINPGGSAFVGSISDIELGQSEQEIFVTMHNYGVTSIWFTSNGGTIWSSKEGNLADMPVKCILQNPYIPSELIIGTEIGVWTTADFTVASPIWIQSYNGMSDVTVLDLDLKDSDKTILASTHGRGFFTSQFSTTELFADFSADKLNPVTNETVNFTDWSINGPTSWTWTFSPTTVTYQGGTTANSQNPQVSFDTSGAYTVTLTVSNGVDSDDEVKVDYITILGLTAEFSAENTTPTLNDTVTFTDQSLNVPTSWVWTFTPNTVTYQGGTNMNSQNPQVTFDAPGNYTVSLDVTNASEADNETKTNYISVTEYCIPISTGTTLTDGCTSDGVKHFVLGTIDNTSGCDIDNGAVGYGDFTASVTDLDIDFDDGNGQGVYQVSIQSAYAPEFASIWIDFNDNFVFEASEQLLSNGSLPTADVDTSFLIMIPATAPLGNHRLRVKAIDVTGTGTGIDDPCGDVQWGESEDYTVNIISSSLSTKDFTETTGLIVYPTISKGKITIRSNLNLGDVKLDVYNISGQKVYTSQLELSSGSPKVLDLNLSSGLYLVKFSTKDNISATKKIVIK